MRFLETKLDGAWLIEPEPIRDSRGYFARTFCTRDFEERGMESRFVQHSRSFSAAKGTLRGLHFQTAPHEEVKLVSCVSGAVYDVIVDMRPGSPTYRQWQGFELTADNKHQLYVPAGFAHGFQTLTDDAELNYLISAFYEPAASTGISYDDPALGVTWPLPVSVISDRDKSWGPLLAA
jgi:dTDP-4-dehydrorhamnose 3,5-epimerase